MPYFISKLQYKDYEKGEFSDEQRRDLADTITIIKQFPWEQQRHLTDVQETGPSITIENSRSEYLKIGLYFNGKYCLYHADASFHVKERPVTSIDEAINFVTDFYEDQLDLSCFERHMFDFNARYHFATNSFIYEANALRALKLSSYFILYFIVFVSLLLRVITGGLIFSMLWPFTVVLSLFTILLGWILLKVTCLYLKDRGVFLQVSKAKATFTYGTSDNETTYNKNDIAEIVTYSPGSSYRNPNTFYVFEIKMNTGEEFKINNIIIPSDDFFEKFQYAKFVSGKKSSIRVL